MRDWDRVALMRPILDRIVFVMDLAKQPKWAALQTTLRSLRSVVVAFSGGVDSAFVLKAAVRTLERENVLAVTGRSESVPSAELNGVADLAAEIGAPHEFLDTREFEDPNY